MRNYYGTYHSWRMVSFVQKPLAVNSLAIRALPVRVVPYHQLCLTMVVWYGGTIPYQAVCTIAFRKGTTARPFLKIQTVFACRWSDGCCCCCCCFPPRGEERRSFFPPSQRWQRSKGSVYADLQSKKRPLVRPSRIVERIVRPSQESSTTKRSTVSPGGLRCFCHCCCAPIIPTPRKSSSLQAVQK